MTRIDQNEYILSAQLHPKHPILLVETTALDEDSSQAAMPENSEKKVRTAGQPGLVSPCCESSIGRFQRVRLEADEVFNKNF